MISLVPEVHLFICLDSRLSPGAILHCLDMARAQDWQQETVLVCDESWKPFVNIDQPVLFIDKNRVFGQEEISGVAESLPYLESFLEQLDNFEIKQITQIGELTWGRWLTVYFESESEVSTQKINWSGKEVSSLQVINDVAHELALDITSTLRESSKLSAVYVDPYDCGQLSPVFLRLLQGLSKQVLPSWLNIVCKEIDTNVLSKYGVNDSLVDWDEVETSLFNQPVLCFSDQSSFAHTSRSYNIAIYGDSPETSLFVPGDISIVPEKDVHVSELFNILAYWRSRRLKELAFQWLNMGIEINCIENFHGRVVKRNLLNYSSDLFHGQILMKCYLNDKGASQSRNISHMILDMRKQVNNDPFALSFSLKILLMILERMIASANAGERLFQRLGSDYHRVIIGEALIEGLIERDWKPEKIMNVKKKLEDFHRYLIKVDFTNDQMDSVISHKESA